MSFQLLDVYKYSQIEDLILSVKEQIEDHVCKRNHELINEGIVSTAVIQWSPECDQNQKHFVTIETYGFDQRSISRIANIVFNSNCFIYQMQNYSNVFFIDKEINPLENNKNGKIFLLNICELVDCQKKIQEIVSLSRSICDSLNIKVYEEVADYLRLQTFQSEKLLKCSLLIQNIVGKSLFQFSDPTKIQEYIHRIKLVMHRLALSEKIASESLRFLSFSLAQIENQMHYSLIKLQNELLIKYSEISIPDSESDFQEIVEKETKELQEKISQDKLFFYVSHDLNERCNEVIKIHHFKAEFMQKCSRHWNKIYEATKAIVVGQGLTHLSLKEELLQKKSFSIFLKQCFVVKESAKKYWENFFNVHHVYHQALKNLEL